MTYNYSNTTKTIMTKGNYEGRLVSEYGNTVAIFRNRKFDRAFSTKRAAREYLNTIR